MWRHSLMIAPYYFSVSHVFVIKPYAAWVLELSSSPRRQWTSKAMFYGTVRLLFPRAAVPHLCSIPCSITQHQDALLAETLNDCCINRSQRLTTTITRYGARLWAQIASGPAQPRNASPPRPVLRERGLGGEGTRVVLIATQAVDFQGYVLWNRPIAVSPRCRSSPLLDPLLHNAASRCSAS
jgi:hypothetical protein